MEQQNQYFFPSDENDNSDEDDIMEEEDPEELYQLKGLNVNQGGEQTQEQIINDIKEENKLIIEKVGISDKELWEFKQAFDFFDVDGGGQLDKIELQKAFKVLGFGAKDSLETLLEALDQDGSKSIDFNEFLALMTKQISAKDTEQDIAQVFSFFDTTGKGFLNIKDLRKIAQEIGINVQDQDLQDMINQASDNERTVDLQQFIDIIKEGTEYEMDEEPEPIKNMKLDDNSKTMKTLKTQGMHH